MEGLYNGREKVINSFKGNIFPVEVVGDKGRVKVSSTPSKIAIRKPT